MKKLILTQGSACKMWASGRKDESQSNKDVIIGLDISINISMRLRFLCDDTCIFIKQTANRFIWLMALYCIRRHDNYADWFRARVLLGKQTTDTARTRHGKSFKSIHRFIVTVYNKRTQSALNTIQSLTGGTKHFWNESDSNSLLYMTLLKLAAINHPSSVHEAARFFRCYELHVLHSIRRDFGIPLQSK